MKTLLNQQPHIIYIISLADGVYICTYPQIDTQEYVWIILEELRLFEGGWLVGYIALA